MILSDSGRAAILPIGRQATISFRFLPALLVLYGCLQLGLGALFSAGLGPGQHGPASTGWGVCAVELIAVVICLARGVTSSHTQRVALVLGSALLVWTMGDLGSTLRSTYVGSLAPAVTIALHLAFYPLIFGGIVMFVQPELLKLDISNWLDGLIGGLAAAAACAVFILQYHPSAMAGNLPSTISRAGYPLGDILLAALLGAVFAATADSRRMASFLLGVGATLSVVGGTSSLFQQAAGHSTFGIILSSVTWSSAVVLMSIAVWLRRDPVDELTADRAVAFGLPFLAAAGALAITFAGTLLHVDILTVPQRDWSLLGEMTVPTR